MEISIRPITTADVPALSAMARHTFYNTFTGTCTEEDMQGFLDKHYNEDQLLREVTAENNHFYFAELDGAPAAYLQFMEDYSGFPMMKKWKALELKRIYVLEKFHGKGIAQQLIQFCIDYARQNNYEVVWLGVWEHNLRAKAFYAKYGFEDSGYTHDFPIGSTPQTDNWLWKFL